MLATFTIAPPGFMVRNACFVKCTAPKRSTLRTFCQSSDVSSSRDLKVISPALLTTTSSRAKRSIAAFTVPATCTSEDTSHATPSASGAPASQASSAPLRRVALQIGDDDARALGPKTPGGGEADPACRARDDRYLVAKPHSTTSNQHAPSERCV